MGSAQYTSARLDIKSARRTGAKDMLREADAPILSIVILISTVIA
jgi:hypothetical protein